MKEVIKGLTPEQEKKVIPVIKKILLSNLDGHWDKSKEVRGEANKSE